MTRRNSVRCIIAATLLAALGSAPLWATRGELALLVDALCLLTLAQMWNLLAGYSGVISLGQQAYVGIGGYVLFVLIVLFGVHPLAATAGAAIAGAVAAACLGPLVFRLKGSFLAIGTWVVAETIRLLVSQWGAVGGGGGASLPVASARQLNLGGFDRDQVIFLLALVVAVLVNLTAFAFLRTRSGLALAAIRDNERAARACGIQVWLLKYSVYVIAGCAGALIGAVTYLSRLRIAPSAAFDISWTSYVLFIVVIGGIGSLEGPIVGTVVFFLLRAALSDLGPWYLVALGVLAVAVMLVAPRGLWGLVSDRLGWSLLPTKWVAPQDGSNVVKGSSDALA